MLSLKKCIFLKQDRSTGPIQWRVIKARSFSALHAPLFHCNTIQASLALKKSVTHSFLEKEMATHSCVLAWRIPGTEEPGGLPSMRSHRVGHNWSNLAAAATGTRRVCAEENAPLFQEDADTPRAHSLEIWPIADSHPFLHSRQDVFMQHTNSTPFGDLAFGSAVCFMTFSGD